MRNPNTQDLLGFRQDGRYSTARQEATSWSGAERIRGIRVESGLDSPDLWDLVGSRKVRLVIVVGTPGDGKSQFLHQFQDQLDSAGVAFAVRHDAAQASGPEADSEFNATIDFLAEQGIHGAADLHEAPMQGQAVALLGINRGLFHRVFEEDSRFCSWRNPRSEHVLVLDLARRYPLGGIVKHDLFGDLVRQITDEKYWEKCSPGEPEGEGCDSCNGRKWCPVLWNVQQLRCGPVVERLRYDLSRLVFSGVRRVTIRDLWDYIASITVIDVGAYRVGEDYLHPCEFVVDVLPGLQLPKLGNLASSWRLLPNLAWGDQEPLAGITRGERQNGHQLSPSPMMLEWLQGVDTPPKTAATDPGVAAGLRLFDPDRTPSPERQRVETRGCIDPAGLVRQLGELGAHELLDRIEVELLERLADCDEQADEESVDSDVKLDTMRRLAQAAVTLTVRMSSLLAGVPREREAWRFMFTLLAERRLAGEPTSASGRARRIVDELQLELGAPDESMLPVVVRRYLEQQKKEIWRLLLRAVLIEDRSDDEYKEAGTSITFTMRRGVSVGAIDSGATVDVTIQLDRTSGTPELLHSATGSPGLDEHDRWLDAMPTSLDFRVPVEVGNKHHPVLLPVRLPVLAHAIRLAKEGYEPGHTGLVSDRSMALFRERLRTLVAQQRIYTPERADGGRYSIALESDAICIEVER
jgi:hypothetical protein